MRAPLAIAFLIALASPVSAQCINLPESRDTGYTANTTARTVCLQQELADDTRDFAIETQTRATLDRIESDLRQFQMRSLPPLKPAF